MKALDQFLAADEALRGGRTLALMNGSSCWICRTRWR